MEAAATFASKLARGKAISPIAPKLHPLKVLTATAMVLPFARQTEERNSQLRILREVVDVAVKCDPRCLET